MDDFESLNSKTDADLAQIAVAFGDYTPEEVVSKNFFKFGSQIVVQKSRIVNSLDHIIRMCGLTKHLVVFFPAYLV